MSQPTAFTAAITPRDFSDTTTDVLRDTWTKAKAAHVIAALAGDTVAIVSDKRTGHTAVGVVLLRTGEQHNGPYFVYEWVGADGKTYTGSCYLADAGTIIPITDRPGAKDARWIALDTWRAQKMAAFAAAKAKHPGVDGKWEMRPLRATLTGVSCTEQRSDGGYPRLLVSENITHESTVHTATATQEV